MLRRATILGVLAILGALVLSRFRAQDDRFLFHPIQGKNNTILFVTDSHPGFCNVHLATVYSLLENHPQATVHYASFPKIAPRLDHLADLARKRGFKNNNIEFHGLGGLGYADTVDAVVGAQDSLAHPPGLAAAELLSKNIGAFICPWPADQYYMLYQALSQLIDDVDPAVVVIDTFFAPGIDATRNKRRLHALITPNILSDMTPAAQPTWTLFWKYPALGSGFPYPIPWKLIPLNIYMNFQIIRGMIHLPEVNAKRKTLKARGIKNPIDFMGLYRVDVPWLTQTLPGVHMPLVEIPRNVTLVGPINMAGLEENTVSAQNLVDWIKGPTVLISLGSGFKYTELRARTMLGAIRGILQETDVQVLWKMVKLEAFDDEFLEAALKEFPGRLRIENWLELELSTLLQLEEIVVFVHHGGAGCFHDALE